MLNENDDWYEQIRLHYGDRTAERSGVPLIFHIDEGLIVLGLLGATERAKKAYCIHPMMQGDSDLVEWFSGPDWLERLYGPDNNAEVVVLAMEYRSVANEYLSTREIEDISEIRLSPLNEVNIMLAADKIQNRKDFEKYHRGTHPRSDALDRYFKNWLRRLGISEERYEVICKDIELRTA